MNDRWIRAYTDPRLPHRWQRALFALLFIPWASSVLVLMALLLIGTAIRALCLWIRNGDAT